MFVPVHCNSCGKSFQVPNAKLGQPAVCPWCQAVVTAQSEAAVPPAPVNPEPLSLDDAPPAPQVPHAPFHLRAKSVVIGLVVFAVVAAFTVAVLQRKHGHLVRTEWNAFTAPDGSCSADLVGQAVEDADAPATGGRRYSSEGRYSGVRTWVGWRNLTPNEVLQASTPEGWRQLRVSVFDPERERLRETFGGYVVKDGTIQFDAPITVEIGLETPLGPLVERIIVKADGPRPRVYFIGIVGKKLAPDGPEVSRLFTSFRLNDQ